MDMVFTWKAIIFSISKVRWMVCIMVYCVGATGRHLGVIVWVEFIKSYLKVMVMLNIDILNKQNFKMLIKLPFNNVIRRLRWFCVACY